MPNSTKFKSEFIGRVRAARLARYETQTEAATALGMGQSKYKQYEKRSMLPHDLVPQFCEVMGVDEKWLFRAKGAGPKWEPVDLTAQPRKPKNPRKTKKRAA